MNHDTGIRSQRAALRLLTLVSLATFMIVSLATPAVGQPPVPAADSVPAAPRVVTGADTVRRPDFPPPITPRRAFFYSLAAPGLAQTILGRPRAAGLFVFSELVTLVMLRETGAELREARTLATDSVFLTSRPDGTPVYGQGPFPRELVRARQAQREDWIAFLLANHLFAGLDAYVAAHLWDVPFQVRAHRATGQTHLTATVRW